VAEAVVEERQLLKTLRWYDGFVLALANPGFLLGSLGYSVADLGGWGAVMMWGITAALIVVSLLAACGSAGSATNTAPPAAATGASDMQFVGQFVAEQRAADAEAGADAK